MNHRCFAVQGSVFRNVSALATVLSTVAFIGTFGGCSSRDIVVNSGPATPLAERDNASAFDGLVDRTGVPAYEFGQCEGDSDCRPFGCDGSVCSPPEPPSVCLISDVGVCLSTLQPSFCGCNQGVCRWDRRPEVLACARIAEDPPGPRSADGAELDWYPVRP